MVTWASLPSGGLPGVGSVVVVDDEDRIKEMSGSGRSGHEPRIRPVWIHAASTSLSSV